MPRKQLDRTAVAAKLGVTPDTITRYRSGDRAAKYAFPEPDGVIGGSAWWWSSTIDRWAKRRSGQGSRTDLVTQ